MPTKKPDYIIAEIWDQIRDLFLSEIDTIPVSDSDSEFLKELLQIYRPINPYISLSVISFTLRILNLLWESENVHSISFNQIIGYNPKGNLQKNDKIEKNLQQVIQTYQTKDDYVSIYFDLYEEIINYVLILPYNFIFNAFKSCKSLKDFRKYVKKHSQNRNSQLKGRYYTPNDIANFVVQKSFENIEFDHSTKILDLCSGTGSFTLHICNLLDQRYREINTDKSGLEIKHIIIKHHLRTIDIDPIATYILRILILLWYIQSQPNISQLSNFITDLLIATKIGNILSKTNHFEEKFDIIISNPPFVSEKSNKLYIDMMISNKNSKYYKPRLDYYLHFLAYALEHVNKGGILGFITPSYFLDTKSASSIRKILSNNTFQLDYYDFNDEVLFSKAPGFHSCIFVCKMDNKSDAQPKQVMYHDEVLNTSRIIPYSEVFLDNFDYMMKFNPKPKFAQLETYTHVLGDIAQIRQGVVSGPDRLRKNMTNLIGKKDATQNQGVFILSNKEMENLKLNKQEYTYMMPFCYVRDITKEIFLLHEPVRAKHKIIYLNQERVDELEIPNLLKHLEQFKPIMKARRENQLGKRFWYELHWPRTRDLFTNPRILSIRRTESPRFIYTEKPFVTDLSTNIIIGKDSINSRKLYNYLISPEVSEWITYYTKKKGRMLQIDKSILERIPIPDEFLNRKIKSF